MLRGPVRPLRIGRARVRVEVADTLLTRGLGLMFRRRLAPDAGVLLCFPRAGHHALHMWHVRFPIEVIWLDDHGTVTGIRRAAPGAGPFRPGRRVRFALEVNAGTCRRLGIRPGQRTSASLIVRRAPAGSRSTKR